MDFGTLLHVAKKNSENKKHEGKYYSTKFAPPKKETKEKKLSDNIQRFLQKREQEEKQRKREQQEKVANLLALRDEKSKNKIKKMLKVTKSANKSVLDDAINSEHTAVTMQGPEQCDADDYGYVSTEANAYYQKYIEKVKDVKEDKGFAPSRPQSLKDLSGTKERVKAAITKEAEEKKSHTRQRSCPTNNIKDSSSSSITRVPSSSKPLYDPETERREEERKRREEEQKRAKNRKPPPPPMDFQALLKLAEKKQHEPIVTPLPEVKKKEPERLLTSKEKRELEERQRAKEARERRHQERPAEVIKDQRKEGGLSRMEPNGRIPKLNNSTKSTNSHSTTAISYKQVSNTTIAKSNENGVRKSTATLPSTSTLASSGSSSKSSVKSSSQTAKQPSKSSTHTNVVSSSKASVKTTYSGPTRAFPPRDQKQVKSRSFPPPDVQKTRQFPPADVQKTRQFPPADVQKTRQFPSADVHREKGREKGDIKRPQPPKRRIFDDDEDDYDSELDDFIDDEDCDMDYSSHIKAIFGYDKSKYRDADIDDSAMESNFAQVQREEYISKKIGMQEDLEDMKQEAIEKKRKLIKKKQKLFD